MTAPVLHLDLKGLKCPHPLLLTRKALAGLEGGARLTVECTDPMSAIDIPHFVASHGHRLVASDTEAKALRFTIEAMTARPLAAMVYGAEEDGNNALRAFASALIAEGETVSGLVQRNGLAADCITKDMELEDLATGTPINICQALGRESTGCRIDPQAMARAAGLLRASFTRAPRLVIINKFGKLEAENQGLIAEIGEAYASGVPVLVGVPSRFTEAWEAFAGKDYTRLPCTQDALRHWWQKVRG